MTIVATFNEVTDRRPAPRPAALDDLKLVEITAGSPGHMIASLAGRDEVHGTGADTVESLLKYRIGGEAFNRSCFAVQDDFAELQSAIYLHKDYAEVKSPRHLCGNVNNILMGEARRTEGQKPLSVIFYSITRLGTMKGTGEILIGRLHKHLTEKYPGTVLSTLSPLRQPKDRFGIDTYFSAVSPLPPEQMRAEEKRAFALAFLTLKKEGVQNFHMGNGATIGDIKVNADRIGTHRLMVNYIYSPDSAELRANAVQYRNSTGLDVLKLASPHLVQEARLLITFSGLPKFTP